jgi:acylphosphatase
VQGVLFRESTRRLATQLGVAGYVRNLDDGTTVEVVAEGIKEHLDDLLAFLKKGPPRARVTSVTNQWSIFVGDQRVFEIRD